MRHEQAEGVRSSDPVNRRAISGASSSPLLAECLAWLACSAILIWLMRDILVYGSATLIHDNIQWRYPIYQFFVENLLAGRFPMWNPFAHGGEPFYPLAVQIKLLDPVVILNAAVGSLFTDDVVMLFNWDRFVQCQVMMLGVYLALRPFARNALVRVAIVPVLLLSSMMLAPFRVHALVDMFLWVPYATIFLLRIVYWRDLRWHNWLLLGVFTGLNWQSYFFAGIWVFLLFFLAGLALFRRDLIRQVFSAPLVGRKVLAFSAVVTLMMGPNVALLLEKDKYVFPARVIDEIALRGQPMGGPSQVETLPPKNVVGTGIDMSYALVEQTGTFSSIWDFLQLLDPEGNWNAVGPDKPRRGVPSEAYLYFGLLPWAVALLGMVLGQEGLKKVWLTVMTGIALLMLGPAGLLHPVLFFVFPPLWFIRHTHIYALSLAFGWSYFLVLGLNIILGEDRQAPASRFQS